MRSVYFVRHSQADSSINDQRTRPLTKKGMHDRQLVTHYLKDKGIDTVYSSPYKRAIDTISDFASANNLPIETLEDFRGLRVDSAWIDNYRSFFEKYWFDFSYSYLDGENFSELRTRNISLVEHIVKKNRGKNIVISTHSVSLAVIISYYDSTFCFEDFMHVVNTEPLIVKMDFNDNDCVSIEKVNLLT